jgi:hypothetical protein
VSRNVLDLLKRAAHSNHTKSDHPGIQLQDLSHRMLCFRRGVES